MLVDIYVICGRLGKAGYDCFPLFSYETKEEAEKYKAQYEREYPTGKFTIQTLTLKKEGK